MFHLVLGAEALGLAEDEDGHLVLDPQLAAHPLRRIAMLIYVNYLRSYQQ